MFYTPSAWLGAKAVNLSGPPGSIKLERKLFRVDSFARDGIRERSTVVDNNYCGRLQK